MLIGRAKDEAVATVYIINTSSAKAKDGTSHTFYRSVACEDDEISPGESGSILFLDWLEKFQRIVEIGVVGPIELWIKADTTTITSTTAVGLAVRSGVVLCQSDHETSVVWFFKVGGEECL